MWNDHISYGKIHAYSSKKKPPNAQFVTSIPMYQIIKFKFVFLD